MAKIPDKLKLVAKKPRKIKAAMKALAEALDRVDADPLGLDSAPLWVEKAWMEVLKVVMPSNPMPSSGKVDVELIGEYFGRLQAFAKLYSGEIPMESEVQAELERAEKVMASQPQSPDKKKRQKLAEKDLQVRMKAVQKGIPNLMDAVMASSHEDALKFQKGLLRGMTLKQEDLITANVFERHTQTLVVLATYWRSIINCKSLREVHGHLCKAFGEQKIGNFKTFEKLCAKIGLSIRGRGRPAGKK